MSVWRYFSWSNQTLATIVLWACSIYLLKEKKNWFITLIPATFMTGVVTAYFIAAPECLAMDYSKAVRIGVIFAAIIFILFYMKANKDLQQKATDDNEINK
jgi:carbon starvation protein CstA